MVGIIVTYALKLNRLLQINLRLEIDIQQKWLLCKDKIGLIEETRQQSFIPFIA